MASTYNGSVANLVDPLANSPLNSPSHATQHTEINDALQTLGTWTSFTPTWTNFTAGNATQSFRYTIFNKVMIVSGTLTLGSTSVMGSSPRFTIPESKTAIGESYAPTRILDSGFGNFSGLVVATSTFIVFSCINAASTYAVLVDVTATAPMTWTTNDAIYFSVAFAIS